MDWLERKHVFIGKFGLGVKGKVSGNKIMAKILSITFTFQPIHMGHTNIPLGNLADFS